MQVVMKLLKDGTGRVCIHWFIRDPQGPIETPGRIHPTSVGPMSFGGARGRIACHPEQNTVSPQTNGIETRLCMHTDDARAATCLECCATPEYIAKMEELKEIVSV
jgi:hypothetical protein